ncbi:MAG: hypothetical protein IPL65_12825 [Lewinellaceae bacterium]|nr:hypothetical protein [Lewinellaceae bacterium]
MRFFYLIPFLLTNPLFAQEDSESALNFTGTNYDSICARLDAYFANDYDASETDCWDNEYVKYQRWKWTWRDRVNPDGSFPRPENAVAGKNNTKPPAPRIAAAVDQRRAVPEYRRRILGHGPYHYRGFRTPSTPSCFMWARPMAASGEQKMVGSTGRPLATTCPTCP